MTKPTHKIDVLDHGHVRLVDHMGSDLSIVRNARVSYDAEWRAGKDKGSDDRLINYLYKNGHNTPFEAVTFTFDILAPIFVFRQWHRHRTQCLSGDTMLKFSRPSDGKPYWKSIKDLHDQWYTPLLPVKRPDKQTRTLRKFKRDVIRNMQLYCIENETDIATTSIVDIFSSEKKPIYKVTGDTGDTIKASADHKFLTTKGWKTLSTLEINDEILSISKVAPVTNAEAPEFTKEELESEIFSDHFLDIEDIEVSNLGRVKRRGELIPLTLNAQGRYVISAKGWNGQWRTIQVSRLVASAFLEDVDDLPATKTNVLHKDDCPLNNRATNLYYGSHQDNHNDALINNRRAFNNVTSIKIISIEPAGEEITYDIEVDSFDHNFIANNFCTHNSYNELSARYKELPEIFYLPKPEQITTQSSDNKQMRTEKIHPEAGWIRMQMEMANKESFKRYHAMLEAGCPRELARSVLPVGTYSHMFATMNLHNLFKFLAERLHEHAQYEIRVYAQAILSLIEPIVPVAVAAFKTKYEGVLDYG